MIVNVNDVELYVEINGEGFPMLLFHGNGEDSSIFRKQVEYFSSCYKVITVDTRAHGKSTRGIQPLNYNTFVNDVVSLMDHLAIEKAVILGFSDGGNIALQMALKYPERIKALVPVGASIFPNGLTLSSTLQMKVASVLMSISSKFNKNIEEKKEIYELMSQHPNLTFDQLKSLSIPTLVIAGENDMIKESHTREIANSIKGAELKIIPGADHFLLFKMFDKVNNIISDFLDTVLTDVEFAKNYA